MPRSPRQNFNGLKLDKKAFEIAYERLSHNEGWSKAEKERGLTHLSELIKLYTPKLFAERNGGLEVEVRKKRTA